MVNCWVGNLHKVSEAISRTTEPTVTLFWKGPLKGQRCKITMSPCYYTDIMDPQTLGGT